MNIVKFVGLAGTLWAIAYVGCNCGTIVKFVAHETADLVTATVYGAYDKPHNVLKSKIKKGLEEGDIIEIDGLYYYKYVVE